MTAAVVEPDGSSHLELLATEESFVRPLATQSSLLQPGMPRMKNSPTMFFDIMAEQDDTLAPYQPPPLASAKSSAQQQLDSQPSLAAGVGSAPSSGADLLVSAVTSAGAGTPAKAADDAAVTDVTLVAVADAVAMPRGGLTPHAADWQAVRMQDLLGDLYIDKSRLEDKGLMGEGGFATVRRCQMAPPGGLMGGGGPPVLVAVKKLHAEVHGQAIDLREFMAEANLLRKLKHPHIVSTYGIGAQEVDSLDAVRRSLYVVMEALEGGTLKMMVVQQMVNHRPYYLKADALRWCIQIARAMMYLHHVCQPMILHRDLKLDNVLLSGGPIESRNSKLADFGLHKRAKLNKAEGMLEACRRLPMGMSRHGERTTSAELSYYGGSLYAASMYAAATTSQRNGNGGGGGADSFSRNGHQNSGSRHSQGLEDVDPYAIRWPPVSPKGSAPPSPQLAKAEAAPTKPAEASAPASPTSQAAAKAAKAGGKAAPFLMGGRAPGAAVAAAPAAAAAAAAAASDAMNAAALAATAATAPVPPPANLGFRFPPWGAERSAAGTNGRPLSYDGNPALTSLQPPRTPHASSTSHPMPTAAFRGPLSPPTPSSPLSAAAAIAGGTMSSGFWSPVGSASAGAIPGCAIPDHGGRVSLDERGNLLSPADRDARVNRRSSAALALLSPQNSSALLSTQDSATLHGPPSSATPSMAQLPSMSQQPSFSKQTSSALLSSTSMLLPMPCSAPPAASAAAAHLAPLTLPAQPAAAADFGSVSAGAGSGRATSPAVLAAFASTAADAAAATAAAVAAEVKMALLEALASIDGSEDVHRNSLSHSDGMPTFAFNIAHPAAEDPRATSGGGAAACSGYGLLACGYTGTGRDGAGGSAGHAVLASMPDAKAVPELLADMAKRDAFAKGAGGTGSTLPSDKKLLEDRHGSAVDLQCAVVTGRTGGGGTGGGGTAGFGPAWTGGTSKERQEALRQTAAAAGGGKVGGGAMTSAFGPAWTGGTSRDASRQPYTVAEVGEEPAATAAAVAFGEKAAQALLVDATQQVGSLMYMAPELLTGDGHYNEKVDVFSYAVIMFELFSGKLLAAKAGLMVADVDTIMAYVMSRTTGARETFPLSWPEPLKALLAAAWAQDPAARPGFRDILARLEKMQKEGTLAPMDAGRNGPGGCGCMCM